MLLFEGLELLEGYALHCNYPCITIMITLVNYGCVSPCCSDCTMIHMDRLEYHIREELNKTSPRTMVVIDPLKVIFCLYSFSLFFCMWNSPHSFCFIQVVITNMEAGLVMNLDAKKWPDAQTDDASSCYKVSKPYI